MERRRNVRGRWADWERNYWQRQGYVKCLSHKNGFTCGELFHAVSTVSFNYSSSHLPFCSNFLFRFANWTEIEMTCHEYELTAVKFHFSYDDGRALFIGQWLRLIRKIQISKTGNNEAFLCRQLQQTNNIYRIYRNRHQIHCNYFSFIEIAETSFSLINWFRWRICDSSLLFLFFFLFAVRHSLAQKEQRCRNLFKFRSRCNCKIGNGTAISKSVHGKVHEKENNWSINSESIDELLKNRALHLDAVLIEIKKSAFLFVIVLAIYKYTRFGLVWPSAHRI